MLLGTTLSLGCATSLEGTAPVWGRAKGSLDTSEAWPVVLASDDLVALDVDEGFGGGMGALGDIDGDGYDDFAKGAEGDDDAGSDAGALYIFHGAKTGLDTARTTKVLSPTGSEGSRYGDWVSGGVDFDADGYLDFLVGAPGTDEAFAYYGGSGGVDDSRTHAITAKGHSAKYSNNGEALSDVDGDGYADAVVGDYEADGVASEDGLAHIFYGTATGLSSTSTDAAYAEDGEDQDHFGNGTLQGDFQCDGLTDLAVSQHNAVYVLTGSVGGLSLVGQDPLTPPERTVTTGYGHLAGGDFDGDGCSDLVVSASLQDAPHGFHYPDIYPGAVYVYYGGEEGLPSDPDLTVRGGDVHPDASDTSRFYSVASAGDFNGDGYDELFVGASGDPAFGILFFGSSEGLAAERSVALEAHDGAVDITSAVGVGDLNGDGYDDLVQLYVPDEAYAYVFWGRCDDEDDDGVCALQDCDDADPSSGEASTLYPDSDGDGYGDPDGKTTSCEALTGHVEDASDCDDGDDSVHPGAEELCNGVDDDCDGSTDGDDAVDAPGWELDADGDGWTDGGDVVTACEAPEGYAEPSDPPDCDDTDAAVHPDAEEVAGDGVDQDCDGVDAELGGDTGTPVGDTGGEGAGGCGEDKGCGTGPAGLGWLALLLTVRRRRRP